MTRVNLCIAIVISILQATFPTHSRHAETAASTVQGKVYRVVRDKQVPANGIPVRLDHSKRGPSVYAYTNSEGMYYLYNVPPDKYMLEVTAKSKILKFEIRVEDKPYTDIQPIRID